MLNFMQQLVHAIAKAIQKRWAINFNTKMDSKFVRQVTNLGTWTFKAY